MSIEAASPVYNRPKKLGRVRTPTMIQMEATECGAVALGIVLAYYGKYVPIAELRVDCGISRDGSNAYNMVLAAEKYDMEAAGYSMSLSDLYAWGQFPVILYWKFEHFLVLEGFGKNCVYINDPATGPRTVTYEELDASFTGVALVATPTEKFTKTGRAPSLLAALYQRCFPVKSSIFFVMLVGLGLVIPNLAFPAFAQVFIDQVMMKHNLSWEYGILVGMLLITVGSGFLNFLESYVLNRLQSTLSTTMASTSFWHMLRLPLMFYLQRYPGEIANRLALNETISNTLSGQAAMTIINVLFVFIYGFAILYYDPIIAFSGFAVILVTIFLMNYVYRARQNAYAGYSAHSARSVAYSIGVLENIETIKASGAQMSLFSTWAGYYTKALNSLQDVQNKDAFLSVYSTLLEGFSYLVLFTIGGWRVLQGDLTIGMFLGIQILLRNMMVPTMQLIGFGQSLQMLRVNVERVDDMMHNPIDPLSEEKEKSAATIPAEKLAGYVELKSVTFGYSPRDEPVIKDISLKLEPGKSVALVGPTGCGKSTIAKIIAGLLIPWSGEILFDEKQRTEIPRRTFVLSLAFVEQQTFLFTGTLKDNLTLLDNTIEFEDVVRAAQDACIHDDILYRIGGYDLELEENGSNFSGGQQQRFEIARAFTKNPTILLIDEAMSDLDSETEDLIIRNLRRRGCAVLMIGHRLSSVRNFDEIIVLDKGNTVGRGTHDALKKSCTLYQELLESE